MRGVRHDDQTREVLQELRTTGRGIELTTGADQFVGSSSLRGVRAPGARRGRAVRDAQASHCRHGSPGQAPAGRVVRGRRGDNEITGQIARWDSVDGRHGRWPRTANGRAELSGLTPGAREGRDGRRWRAARVEGHHVGSRAAFARSSCPLRHRETCSARSASGRAAAPPLKGTVVFGPESRIIAELPKIG